MESKKTLLIVDDQEFVVEAIKTFFYKKFNVLTAYDGKKAIELYKSNNIDIVLSDIEMPIMNGLELLYEIKKIKPNALVYLMSLRNHPEASEKGAAGFLQKPLNMKNLNDLI